MGLNYGYWDGLIGEVMETRAHLAATTLTIIPESPELLTLVSILCFQYYPCN